MNLYYILSKFHNDSCYSLVHIWKRCQWAMIGSHASSRDLTAIIILFMLDVEKELVWVWVRGMTRVGSNSHLDLIARSLWSPDILEYLGNWSQRAGFVVGKPGGSRCSCGGRWSPHICQWAIQVPSFARGAPGPLAGALRDRFTFNQWPIPTYTN